MVVREWTRERIGDLANSISETHSFDKEQLIFLNTSDIFRGQILHRNYSMVKNFPGQAKKSIRKGDILFSEIRPANGRYAFIDFGVDDYVVSTKLMVIRARENILSKYLYHFLTSTEITNMLQHLAESRSGTFPQITFEQVASLELDLPSIKTQESIVAFIDALSSKIELNRQMNRTLEAITQAIFKHWFIDCEFPNEKGKPYKSSGGEMVDSELGEIPEGWETDILGHILEFAYGDALKEGERISGPIPVFGSNGQIGWHNKSLVKGPGIVIGRKGNHGIVTWSPTDFFPIDTTFYVVLKEKIKSLYFLFYALKAHNLPSLGADSAIPGYCLTIQKKNRF